MKVSLDNINPEANEAYSKALFEFVGKKLGAPGDRGYMCVAPSSEQTRMTEAFPLIARSPILEGRTLGEHRHRLERV